MLDFRKNKLLDDLFLRYLESSDLTLETEDRIGSEFYQSYILMLFRNFKKESRTLDRETKKYQKFKLKERKYQIKCENLKFLGFDFDIENTGGDLSVKERWRYRFRKRRYKRIIKRYRKLIQKYKLYLPSDVYKTAEDAEIYLLTAISVIEVEEDVTEDSTAMVQEERPEEPPLVEERDSVESQEISDDVTAFFEEDCADDEREEQEQEQESDEIQT